MTNYDNAGKKLLKLDEKKKRIGELNSNGNKGEGWIGVSVLFFLMLFFLADDKTNPNRISVLN